jgi:hypothetical protein
VNSQTVGNVGMYYVCYQLSRMGWNVMPTARNARGIDVLIYSQDADRKHTIQVKTLSKGSPVPLGNNLDHLYARRAYGDTAVNDPIVEEVREDREKYAARFNLNVRAIFQDIKQ